MAKQKRMKGQMFIVAAIFIVLSMIAIKNMLGAPEITEEKRFIQSQATDRILYNIITEYGYAVGIALAQPEKNNSGISYLSNLSSFMRKDIKYFTSFYAFAYVNSTTGKYSVTIGNYLYQNATVLLNATDSSPAGYLFEVTDATNATKEFSYSAGISQFNITINYTAGSGSDKETFTVVVSNSSAAYFDVRLNEDTLQLRAKEVYNRTVLP